MPPVNPSRPKSRPYLPGWLRRTTAHKCWRQHLAHGRGAPEGFDGQAAERAEIVAQATEGGTGGERGAHHRKDAHPLRAFEPGFARVVGEQHGDIVLGAEEGGPA